jgi:hypothetical protein
LRVFASVTFSVRFGTLVFRAGAFVLLIPKNGEPFGGTSGGRLTRAGFFAALDPDFCCTTSVASE